MVQIFDLPAEAQPWDVARAMMADVGVLLVTERRGEKLAVHGYEVRDADAVRYYRLQDPIEVEATALDNYPEWLERILSACLPA